MSKRRVVVTGLGAVTPIGNNVKDFWAGIREGKVGIGSITKFDTTDYKVKIAAEVKDFNAKDHVDPRSARRMDPFCQYAVTAAKEALEDSGIDMEKEDSFRAGVIVGSGIGSLPQVENNYEKILTKGPGKVNPLMVPMMISNMAAGSQFDEASAAVAPQYPDTVYTVINGTASDSDNMVPVFPKEYEGSYLAGIIAGYTTENGKFATEGGESNAAMVKLLDTYEGAAKEVAEERGIEGAEANRSFLNTWTDVSVTKSMTDQMIDNGADTVFCYSNEGASGAVQSAEEKGAKFVAFAANKNDESDCVVASVNMNWSNVYPWIVEGIASGELKGAQEVGVAEGVFEAIYTDAVSDECKSAVEQATQDITDGKIDFTQYFSEAE